ncbi:MAG: RICIN domain-containing protein, partial [Streptosporangiaceae bacterium]|nr:RICIN domain-containing protein [Streptosporangiaceae bacterium]
SVTADVSIGAFTVGPVQVSSPMFYLDLSVTQSTAAFGISGGISYNGNSFYADIQFAVGTSAAGASVTLAADGQLSVPIAGYLAGGLTLYRAVSGDGSGASISASGSAWLTAGGSTLGPVSFYFSIPGSLSWTDVANSITQVAQFFVTTGNSADTVIQYLQHIGYDTYDIINALSEIGDWGPRVVSGLANAFGFSSTYYDIWTFTSSAESLVLDVSGGSQSPSASVITWDWNNGYNQDWAFVQSPYPGWYEVVNRGSGQCLTVQYNTSTWGNPLIQYPCGGAYNQLWYMGSISLGTTYSIPNALDDEVIDVAGAYPWPGGSLDQWPYNGGWNQQFWLTNSHN